MGSGGSYGILRRYFGGFREDVEFGGLVRRLFIFFGEFRRRLGGVGFGEVEGRLGGVDKSGGGDIGERLLFLFEDYCWTDCYIFFLIDGKMRKGSGCSEFFVICILVIFFYVEMIVFGFVWGLEYFFYEI